MPIGTGAQGAQDGRHESNTYLETPAAPRPFDSITATAAYVHGGAECDVWSCALFTTDGERHMHVRVRL
jgi:hypothetical protein